MFARLTKRGALIVMLLSVMVFGHPGIANVTAEEEHDSFPISTFAMFSVKRDDVHSMPFIRGTQKDGKVVYIRSRYIAPGGMNQTLHFISRTQRRSRSESRELCKKVAKRISRSRRYRKVQTLEVVRGYYRPEVIFGQGDDTPVRERIYARCRVHREKEEKEEKSQ